MPRPVVKMIQLSKNRWQIVGPKDNVLQADITSTSIDHAQEYVKKYISSFSNWDYILIPLAKYSDIK